jgi:hypothetical protein
MGPNEPHAYISGDIGMPVYHRSVWVCIDGLRFSGMHGAVRQRRARRSHSEVPRRGHTLQDAEV